MDQRFDTCTCIGAVPCVGRWVSVEHTGTARVLTRSKSSILSLDSPSVMRPVSHEESMSLQNCGQAQRKTNTLSWEAFAARLGVLGVLGVAYGHKNHAHTLLLDISMPFSTITAPPSLVWMMMVSSMVAVKKGTGRHRRGLITHPCCHYFSLRYCCLLCYRCTLRSKWH